MGSLGVKVRALITARKKLVEAGDWLGGGSVRKMPKTAFPLSPTRSFVLGKRWRWRVDKLEVVGTEARLLTAFEPSREKFLSWLSLGRDGGYAIVARYEFHGEDEPGWHGHCLDTTVARIPIGQVKPYGTVRVPAARGRHRRTTYEVTEASALATSFRVFRVENVPEDAML